MKAGLLLVPCMAMAFGGPMAIAQPATPDSGPARAAPAPADAAELRFGDWGVDLTARDATVKPGDDFWAYANGGWDKRSEIPPDRTGTGVGELVADEVERQVRQIAEDMARDPAAAGAAGRQVGDFYASWMDEAGIEARGLAPLAPYLAAVEAVRTRSDYLRLLAQPGYTMPVELGVIADPEDPTRYVAFVRQAGLGLPNRDYYLEPGEKLDAIRRAYRDYVVRIQTLAGIPDAAAKADRIIELETELAKVQWTPERQRDIGEIYNPMDRAEMMALAPQFEWPDWLQATGLGNVATVVVAEPSAIQGTGKLLESMPLSTWKAYSAYHFVRAYAQYLPRALDQANFAFFDRTLRDQPEQRPRWKRGVALLNDRLGEAVGQIYVERYYPPESARQMGELIANLRASLAELIERNEWMDEATRKEALAKLASFDPRIGHPATYVDYSPLRIDRADLLGNAVRASDFDWKLELSHLGKPVDRDVWNMTPQELNAEYDPSLNQITFPAAVLQPPLFDPANDPAVNYGSIGAGIGHEIEHGFDDEGREFDASGRLRDWWTAEAARKLTDRTRALREQFDRYEPLPGVHINGDLTMGENIGDLGGLEMAYVAYRRYVAEHGEPPLVDGLTGDQRFFLAYAQTWRRKVRDGALREQLLTGPHSPPKYRVNGVVRNLDAWYAAFDIKPGDALYLPPEQRVHIW